MCSCDWSSDVCSSDLPSYKKLPGKALSVQQEWCNAKIAKPRIKSEHCIGLIKGKFQYFKCICVQMHEKKDMHQIIHLFTCAVILLTTISPFCHALPSSSSSVELPLSSSYVGFYLWPSSRATSKRAFKNRRIGSSSSSWIERTTSFQDPGHDNTCKQG